MQKKRIIFSYLKSLENAAEKKTKYNKKNVHFVWKKCTFRFADYTNVVTEKKNITKKHFLHSTLVFSRLHSLFYTKSNMIFSEYSHKNGSVTTFRAALL